MRLRGWTWQARRGLSSVSAGHLSSCESPFNPKEQHRLASKTEHFSQWYTQVLLRSEVLDYSDVSGCHILRPWGLSLWSHLQSWLDARLADRGVQNAYFPLLIPEAALAREACHVEGFAPEVAWVTHAGREELAGRLAVRPTSETAMYPAFARWIKSHRDLPLKLNQWCNVVRWESRNPMPLIRSREFLWQEGHSAFACAEDAARETLDILELYASAYEQVFAVPVIRGRKSSAEKFAGAVSTLSIEAFIPAAGRAIQAATAHNLGQNFSKMFGIRYEAVQGERMPVWQTSWGFTTRALGIAVMMHGDERGLLLPPRVAPLQVVIVPVGIRSGSDPGEVEQVRSECQRVEALLAHAGVRAKADLDVSTSPGWKFNQWELKGVPLRIEVGPKEVQSDHVVIALRHQLARATVGKADMVAAVRTLLDSIQADLLERARHTSAITTATTWPEVQRALQQKAPVLAPWCEQVKCEARIRQQTGVAEDGSVQSPAKSLCIPLEQPSNLADSTAPCAFCSRPARSWTLFGRSY